LIKTRDKHFWNQYDKVDKDIREVFHKMTGGNAWLEYKTKMTYLLQGIISCTVPNKQKRESTSISGGEKTLAAKHFF